jgi:hypothetical protein
MEYTLRMQALSDEGPDDFAQRLPIIGIEPA